jgi:hypothetical protein
MHALDTWFKKGEAHSVSAVNTTEFTHKSSSSQWKQAREHPFQRERRQGGQARKAPARKKTSASTITIVFPACERRGSDDKQTSSRGRGNRSMMASSARSSLSFYFVPLLLLLMLAVSSSTSAAGNATARLRPGKELLKYKRIKAMINKLNKPSVKTIQVVTC